MSNQQTLTVSGTLAATAAITNSGVVTVASGATLSDTGAAYTQTAGTTTVTGTLASDHTVSINAGTLAGGGTVAANVYNAATVSAGNVAGTSSAVLTINGNYTQTSAGTLLVRLGGTSPGVSGYSQLAVSGSASLAGALTLSLSYAANSGDSYQVVSASSLTGAFNNVPQGQFSANGATYSSNYQGTGELLTYLYTPVSWTGATNNEWNTASNWSTQVVPGANNSVTIGANETVSIDSTNASVYNLTLSSGSSLTVNGVSLTLAAASSVAGNLTLQGSGTLAPAAALTVSGSGSTFTWNSGTISGAGQLVIASTGTLNVPLHSGGHGFGDGGGGGGGGPVRTLELPLVNSGTANFNDTQDTSATSAGVITNQAGANFNLNSTGSLAGASATFTNDGTFTSAPGSGNSVTFGIPLTNAAGATFSVQNGTLSVATAITNQGTTSVSGTLTTSATFTNTGSVAINGGATLATTGTAYQQTAGTTTVAGTLSSTQMISLAAGVLTGTGVIAANLTNAATVSPGNAAGTSVGTLTVTGNYTQNASGTLLIDLAAPGTSSQLAVTGNVALDGALALSLTYSDSPGDNYEIINQQSGSGVSGMFANLPEGSEALALQSQKAFFVTYLGGTGNDVSLTAAAHDVVTWIGGYSNDWNDHRNWAGQQVPNSTDDVVIPAGANVSLGSGTPAIDKLTLSGALEVSGGASLAIAGNSTVNGTLTLADGTLTDSGVLTVNGTLDWYDGTLTGTGSTAISATGTLNIADGSVSNPVGRMLEQPLTNAGTVAWSASRVTTATDTGAITNQASGVFNIENSTGGLAISASTPPTFTNAGTLTFANGTSTFSFAEPIDNTGSLTVQSGTLTFIGAFSNQGAVTIEGGATLSVTGATYQQSTGTTTTLGTLSSDESVDLAGGILTGTGTIAASLTNGGTVSPGTASGNTAGTLVVQGDYAQASGGTLLIDLGGIATGTYSQLDVSGSVNLDGTLAVSVNYAAAANDNYQVVSQQSNAPISGTFRGIAEGGVVVGGTKAFVVTYRAGATQNDVGLTCANYDVVTWVGGYSNNWGDGQNWTGTQAPTSIDEVIIPAGATVTISSGAPSIDNLTLAGSLQINSGTSLTLAAPSTVSGSLTLAGGTLDGAGDLTVTGTGSTLNWKSGTLQGTGRIVIDSAATLNILAGSGRVLARALQNSGTLNWTGTQATSVTATGAFTNESGGLINLESNSGLSVSGGSAATFTNQGTIALNPAQTFSFGIPLSSSGTINVESGTLQLSDGGTTSGTINVAAGANLSVITNTYSFASGAAVSGPGTFTVASGSASFAATGTSVTIASVVITGGTAVFGAGFAAGATTLSGGTADFNQNATVSALTLSGGTLAGSGTVTLIGTATLNSGVIGAAQTIIASGATANVNATTLVLSGLLTNEGSFLMGSSLALANGGGAGQFTNAGTFVVPAPIYDPIFHTYAPATLFVTVPFNQTNAGTLTVNSQGTVDLSDGGSSAGSITLASSAVLNVQGHDFDFASGASLAGAGQLNVTAGSISFVGSDVSVDVAQFNVVGSVTLNIDADTTLPNLDFGGSGALVNLAANLTLEGTNTLAGGEFLGYGQTLTVDSSALANVTEPTSVFAQLVNAGTVNVSGYGTLSLISGFVNDQGGLVALTGSTLYGNGAGTLPFTNYGTVTVTQGSLGTGNTQFYGLPVANDGVFNVVSGTALSSNIWLPAQTSMFTNDGVLTVALGATLSVSGGVFSQAAGVSNVLGTLSSNETVQIGGGKLDGTGTVAANVWNAAVIAPGYPDGLLTITGNYSQTDVGAISIETIGTIPGTDYGQLLVDGSVSLSGTVHVDTEYAAQPGDSYLVLLQHTTAAIQGTLFGVPQGGELVDNSSVYQVSYTAGTTANELKLTALQFNQVLTQTPPSFTVNDVLHLQATAGTVDYVFTVTLNQAESLPVSVNYSTLDLSATAGQDYLPTQGTLTFLPGQTSQTVTVHALSNPNPEPTKRFELVLTDPQDATHVDATGIGTIQGTLSTNDLASTGNDFWFAVPATGVDLYEVNRGTDETPTVDVLISSALGSQGTISIPGTGFEENWQVDANGVADVNIPTGIPSSGLSLTGGSGNGSTINVVTTTDGIENLGVHVVANGHPVSVYVVESAPFTADGFTALPTPVLGTDYRVMSYTNDVPGLKGTRFTVVATVDGTVLHFTQGQYDIEPMPSSVTLNAGQVFQFEDTQNANSDVTGTRIQSNEPIAVIGGSLAVDIPAGVKAADTVMDEMPPTADWGTYFVTAPLKTRDGDTFRVLANQDGTVVSIDNQVVATLLAGQYYETILTSASLITANQPILVAQYSNSENFDGQQGDPFEKIVSPIEEFGKQYTVGIKSYVNSSNSDDPGFDENFVNLIVPNSAIGSVEMNGRLQSPTQFTAVGTSGYSYAQIVVAAGVPTATYTFTTTSGAVKFGASVYAFSSYASYGYLGGYGTDSAAYADTISLSPTTDAPYVGAQASVTATVMGPAASPSGTELPLIGAPVQFVITGANPETVTVYTNGAGQATLTYRGQSAGADAIQAFVAASLTSNGQPLVATAAKSWVQVAPTIQIVSPSGQTPFAAGTNALISGTATPGAPGVPIVAVSMNGQPVDALDAAGNFFAHVTLPEGSTTLTFVATDALGNTATCTLTLSAVSPAQASADDTYLIPSASFAPTYYRTSFDEASKILYADVTFENAGQYPLGTPLYVAVGHLSDPTILLRNYAGVLADGTPYYNLSSLVSGNQLSPNASTQTATLEFYNPTQARFTYTLELVGGADPGPSFQSTPPVTTSVGSAYRYQTSVTDMPGDTLTYSLAAGPSGMAISSTGLVTWTPAAGTQGTYSILLAVTNQYGAQALQHYILTVANVSANLPPLFTSTPVVSANVLTSYQYTATATDADGDTLTYALVDGPAGLSINGSSGVVTWTPTAAELGAQTVTISVSDGNGGSAQQSFVVQVLPQAGDIAPVIDDNPTDFTIQMGAPFLHQVHAIDAQGHPLTYSFAAPQSGSAADAPAGMTIDPNTGLVNWTPTSAGTATFTVQVADGLGGLATQTYTLTVVNTTPGSISGTVFNDLNSDGAQQSGEGGLSGWTVYLDLHHDQTLEADDPQTVTDANGNYTFAGIAPGTYELGIVPQSGWFPTLPTPGTATATVVAGQSISGENFGLIAEIPPEEPPVLAPVVNLTAVVGQPLTYQVVATSPQGYPLTYAVDASLWPGVGIDAKTGLLTWTPNKAAANNVIQLHVSDTNGGNAVEQINVTVNQHPTPPVITSEPPLPAVAGSPYQYQVEAQDSNPGTTLNYQLLFPPSGMTIESSTGLLSWTPPPGQTTTVDVVIVVSDNLNASAFQEFELVAVQPVPEIPPSFTSQPLTTGLVNVPYVYQLQATSAFGTALSYSLLAGPPGMSLSASGLITWITATAQTVPVTVEVSDAEGGSATQAYNLTISSTASAVNPVITSNPPGMGSGGQNSTAELGYQYEYQVTVSDPSGTPDNFSLTSAPAGMSIDPANGLITWLPQSAALPGPYAVTIQVTNETGGSATQSFNLVLASPVPNVPIWITSTAPAPAVVGEPYQYQIVADDPNGSPVSYWLDSAVLTASGGSSSTTALSGVTLSSTGLLSFTATGGQVGIAQVTVMATDAWGAQATQTFVLPIGASSQDRQPVITSNPATAPIPVGDNYHYQVIASDADGDPLTYSLENSPAGMAIDPQAGLFTWTPTHVGTNQVNIDVSDGRGGVARQTFTLTVVAAGSAADQSPTITSAPTQPAVVGQVWQYQVVANDADDDALSYALTANPTGMSISSTGLVTWTAATAAASNPVTIIVSDGRGGTATQSFMLASVTNVSLSAPVFTSVPAETVLLGQSWQYQAVASDPQGDAVTYELGTAQLSGMEINPVTGLVTWTPSAAQAGPQTVSIVAIDAQGQQATQTFPLNVTILATSNDPVITSAPPINILVGTNYVYLATATDPNGLSLSYSLTGPVVDGVPTAPPAGMTINSAGQIFWTPTLDQIGPNPVTLVVTDSSGAFATQSFTINVNTVASAQSPPVITSTPPTVAIVGQVYAYNATGQDPQNEALAWSLEGPVVNGVTTSPPNGMSINPLTGTIRWIPTLGQLGPQTVVVRLTDAGGSSVTQSVTLQIVANAAPPRITTTPPTTGTITELYVYQVGATTSTGQPLTYALVPTVVSGVIIAPPSGMTINSSSGELHWTPYDYGPFPITVQVTDVLGQTATQTYNLNVSLLGALLPPVIVTQPVTSAIVGTTYSQQIIARDPQGQPITFSLIGYSGISINPQTGLITWLPPGAGSYGLTVVATDTSGLFAVLTYTINVQSNVPPVITSKPLLNETAGLAYQYDVQADQPDQTSTILSYALIPTVVSGTSVSAPAGMTIDSQGRVTWNLSIADIGQYPITVQVTNSAGLSTTQTYTLNVTADTQAPTIVMQTSAQQVPMAQSFTVLVQATDNVGVTSLTLTATFATSSGTTTAPVALVPNASGTGGIATLTYTTYGVVTLQASAGDAAGNVGTATAAVTVIDPSVVDSPTAIITSPTTNQNVPAPIPVIGTVSDPQNALLSWSLTVTPDYTGELPSDSGLPQNTTVTTIATGTSPITNGTLGTLDPTLLANGNYTLTLSALNAGGLTSTSTVPFTVSGNLKLGSLNLSFTDMTVKAAGISIAITRSYSTLNANQEGDFGYGWTLSESNTKVQIRHQNNDLSGFGDYVPMEDGDRVIITLPDGTVDKFTFEAQPGDGIGSAVFYYEPAFIPDAGTRDQLIVNSAQLQQVGNEFVDESSGDAYNPALPEFGGTYTVQMHNGTQLTIDATSGDLSSISDLNNNTLTFTGQGIESSSGQFVQFERDQNGRITSITSSGGQTVSYGYDASGNLISFTDAAGNTTQFTYLGDPAHYLSTIIGPTGVQEAQFQYTSDGRVSSVTNADGNTENLGYDLNALSQTTTDALGNPTTTTYDDNGNPVEVVNALGGITRSTYDSNNDLLSTTEVTAEGNLTTTYTYDAFGDQTSVTNPDGTTTSTTYDQFGDPLTRTDSLGNVTTYNYDANGNLQSVSAPGQGATIYTYDAQGNPVNSTVVGEGTTSYSYDSAGNPLSETDPTGITTSFSYDSAGNQTGNGYDWVNPSNPSDIRPVTSSATYDNDGNVTSETGAAGNTSSTTYTPLGQVATMTDSNGDVTQNTYDPAGNMIETREQSRNSSGNLVWEDTLSVYDADGRVIAQTDPVLEGSSAPATGRITTYDQLGAVTQTQAVTGIQITITGSGSNVHAVLMSPGTVVTSSTTQYDNQANEVSSTDQFSHQTLTTYDQLGRVVDSRTQSVDQNGNIVWIVARTVYDAQGRVSFATDQYQEGSSTPVDGTETIYDQLGRAVQTIRLQGVQIGLFNATTGQPVDPLNAGNAPIVSHVTNWGTQLYTTKTVYNSLGQTVESIAEDGQVTNFEYDSLGRQTAQIGQAVAPSTVGLSIPAGDPAGTLVRLRAETAYDINGNIASTTANVFEFVLPDGTTQIDRSQQQVTQYQYDQFGNVVQTIYPDDSTTSSTYDSNGNKLTSTDQMGQTTQYEYDAENRVVQETLLAVKNPATGQLVNPTYRYGYDTNGNQTGLTDPNGGLTTFTFDS